MADAFCNASIKRLPKIIGTIGNNGAMFSGLSYLEGELPDDFFNDMTLSQASTCITRGFFSGWKRIKSTPLSVLSGAYTRMPYNSAYSGMFNYNYCRHVIENLPIPFIAAWAFNAFSNTFQANNCLKKMTFESGKTVKWKNQTITLTGAGYSASTLGLDELIEVYGEEKRITDASTYESLKNDPEAWTSLADYSLYNHDSAVETINSLPDASAYLATTTDTNTIKFTGAAGALTDGGAISTLTETEIAVATAKGWTVSIT